LEHPSAVQFSFRHTSCTEHLFSILKVQRRFVAKGKPPAG